MLDKLFKIVSADLGIDLGTSTTLIYQVGKGVVIREPTVVVRNKKTKEIIAFGTEAKKMMGRTPAILEVIKPLRDGVIFDFDACQAMLANYFRQLHQTYGWRVRIPRPRVVISIPTGVTEVERRAVGSVAQEAGARKVFLLEEPMAAAIGANIPIFEAAGALIVNLGGGSVELAVISLGGIVINKTVKITGEDLDEAIVNYLRLKYSLLIGLPTAEELKINIGSVLPPSGGEDKKAVVRGRDLATGLPRSIKIDGSEVREAIAPFFSQICGVITDILSEAPPELLGDISQRGVYITGGLAHISGACQLIEEEIKMPTVKVEDPGTVVVRGCGMVMQNDKLRQRLLLAGGLKKQ